MAAGAAGARHSTGLEDAHSGQSGIYISAPIQQQNAGISLQSPRIRAAESLSQLQGTGHGPGTMVSHGTESSLPNCTGGRRWMHGFTHTGLCRAGEGFQRSLCGQEKQGGLDCHDEVNLQGEAYKQGTHIWLRSERQGLGKGTASCKAQSPQKHHGPVLIPHCNSAPCGQTLAVGPQQSAAQSTEAPNQVTTEAGYTGKRQTASTPGDTATHLQKDSFSVKSHCITGHCEKPAATLK